MSRNLDTYLAEARSWETDRLAVSERNRRAAVIVAGVGWIVALIAAGTLWRLVPLKRVEPYVLRIDSRTGIVDEVPRYVASASVPEVVTRYLLTRYTTVCEEYLAGTAENDYEECGAFQSAARNAQWAALWNPANPQSPLNRFKDGTRVRVQVQSVSFFTRVNGTTDLAQVRYLKLQQSGAEAAELSSPWIATLQYRYGPPSDDARRRAWNPLGLKVLEFRTQPEVPAPATSPTAWPAGVAR